MGSVRLYGATSGYLELQAPDVAPDSTLVLPSDSLQPGLVHLHTESFSAKSSVSVDDVFSSTYDFYRILISLLGSTAITYSLRLRASGTDASGANTYKYQEAEVYSSSTSNNARSENFIRLGWSDSSKRGTTTLDVFGPNLAATTGFNVPLGGRFDDAASFIGEHTVASAYDGFTIFPSSGTITGTLRVYGYRNS